MENDGTMPSGLYQVGCRHLTGPTNEQSLLWRRINTFSLERDRGNATLLHARGAVLTVCFSPVTMALGIHRTTANDLN